MPLTLNGSGTVAGLSTGVNGVGKVLQVVNAVFTTPSSTTSGTRVDMGLSATITPNASSSKILAIASLGIIGMDAGAMYSGASLWLMRGSSDLVFMSEAACYTGTTNANRVGGPTVTYLDSPASTSATIYKIQWRCHSGGLIYTNPGNSSCTMTLLEIAA